MALAVRGSAWGPFGLVRQWDTDFDELVRRAFNNTHSTGFVPSADVTREGNDVLVTVELPGVEASDVDIEVLGGRLTISGKRSARTESKENGVLFREIRSGGFRRQFTLPKGVTAEQIEADYDNGLLKVRVRDAVAPAPVATKVKVRSLTAGETEAPAEALADAPAEVKAEDSGSEN